MLRTTIALEKPVEKELRRLAAERESSLSEMANDLIKRGLESQRKEAPAKTSFQWHASKGKPASSIDFSDRGTYLDLISRKTP